MAKLLSTFRSPAARVAIALFLVSSAVCITLDSAGASTTGAVRSIHVYDGEARARSGAPVEARPDGHPDGSPTGVSGEWSERTAQGAALRCRSTIATNIGGDPTLYRLGSDPFTINGLMADAVRAEAGGFPYGFSTSTRLPPRFANDHRSARVSDIEDLGLCVEQTGNKPEHHTVRLSKPITQDMVDALNRIFT